MSYIGRLCFDNIIKENLKNERYIFYCPWVHLFHYSAIPLSLPHSSVLSCIPFFSKQNICHQNTVRRRDSVSPLHIFLSCIGHDYILLSVSRCLLPHIKAHSFDPTCLLYSHSFTLAFKRFKKILLIYGSFALYYSAWFLYV